ncbi:hypothetical protein LJC74_06715 [Eubacteriales bacterium OttesenSCG-928-A19]|nr:hypothetical protein [Eubacteriales bacterium OttesenSCG-928-A19]
MYCDSAASCIIIIVTGATNAFGSKREAIAISHLSRPGRFSAFFSIIKRYFTYGDLQIYAAGANPPEPYQKTSGEYDYTARNNALQVMQWIDSIKDGVKQVSLRFGEGNPAIEKNNLDCLGISAHSLQTSNARITLTLDERDPTGGLQTLFCMYANPSLIRNQSKEFTDTQKTELVRIAHGKSLHTYVNAKDEVILKTFSSTPEFEVPWFCDTIRQAARYVEKNHK